MKAIVVEPLVRSISAPPTPKHKPDPTGFRRPAVAATAGSETHAELRYLENGMPLVK